MSIAEDNLKTNYGKVAYTNYFDADKIAVYSSIEDSSGIGQDGSITAAFPAVATDYSVTVAAVPNPYGKKLLGTMSWSVDHVNYYPTNVPIFYFNPTFNAYLWRGLAFIGCSDSTIYLGVTSQYTSTQPIYLQFSLDSPL